MVRSGKFTVYRAPTLTTWGGSRLSLDARKQLKIGDIVRVRIGECGIYFEIKRFSGRWQSRRGRTKRGFGRCFQQRKGPTCSVGSSHCIGVVNDPYNACCGFRCNECLQYYRPDLQFYGCTQIDRDDKDTKDNTERMELINNLCNYHVCAQCVAAGKSNHEHKVQHIPLTNGALYVFRRSAICEIPDWTKNTWQLNERCCDRVIESMKTK